MWVKRELSSFVTHPKLIHGQLPAQAPCPPQIAGTRHPCRTKAGSRPLRDQGCGPPPAGWTKAGGRPLPDQGWGPGHASPSHRHPQTSPRRGCPYQWLPLVLVNHFLFWWLPTVLAREKAAGRGDKKTGGSSPWTRIAPACGGWQPSLCC